MNDPLLIAVKEYVKAEVESGAVHPVLVGNFDQVWTTLYEPASRVVWKNAAKQGSVKDLDVEDGKWYKRRHVATQLRISLGLDTAALKGRSMPSAKKDDAYNSAGCVNNWRASHHDHILSWRNGEVGRLFVTIASDKVTEQQLQEAKALRGFAVVERAQGPTHMWRGQTMVRYLAKHGLTLSHRALVICDDASQHSDQRFQELRQLWEDENNCQLLGADKNFRIKVPGGFGACGGPNDQWHNTWRLLRRAWLRKATGGANNPAFARQYQELQFDLSGQVSLKTPLLVSLASDVYALKSLAAHRKGNIIMSSWLKLGYISAQELANLRFAGRLEDLEACMSHVRGSMEALLQLDVLPDLGLEAAAQELDNGQISRLCRTNITFGECMMQRNAAFRSLLG